MRSNTDTKEDGKERACVCNYRRCPQKTTGATDIKCGIDDGCKYHGSRKGHLILENNNVCNSDVRNQALGKSVSVSYVTWSVKWYTSVPMSCIIEL